MYKINDPSIIDKLIELVGDRETGIKLYGDAVYICEKLHTNDFGVTHVNGSWTLGFDDISQILNKHMTVDD